jgi:hypothetical protein
MLAKASEDVKKLSGLPAESGRINAIAFAPETALTFTRAFWSSLTPVNLMATLSSESSIVRVLCSPALLG